MNVSIITGYHRYQVICKALLISAKNGDLHRMEVLQGEAHVIDVATKHIVVPASVGLLS